MKLPRWIAAPLELVALVVLRERGPHVMGRRHGVWVRRFRDGRLFTETSWELDVRHGRERRWYLDGTPRFHGMWRDGVRTGEWIFLTRDERVDPERTGVYENGEKIAPVRGYNDWKH